MYQYLSKAPCYASVPAHKKPKWLCEWKAISILPCFDHSQEVVLAVKMPVLIQSPQGRHHPVC